MTETETWAIVELMGHLKLAGRLTEEEKFGSKLGRIDIPDVPAHPQTSCIVCSGQGTFGPSGLIYCPDPHCGPRYITRYFGGASVYSLTIVTEAVARHVASRSNAADPVQPWEYPKGIVAALPAAKAEADDDQHNEDSMFV